MKTNSIWVALMILGAAFVPAPGHADAAGKLEGPTTPKGVSDKELDSIQLAKEVPGIGNRWLRARRVKPVTETHSQRTTVDTHGRTGQ